MTTAGFALRNAPIITFAAIVLAMLGIHSYLVAPESIFPDMHFSRVDVVAEAGDLPPERVRIAVTRPLETAFATLPSVSRVRATSSQGSAELILDFASSTDPHVDLQYAEQAIASLRSSIPAAKTIDAVVINPNSEPVVSYMVRSRSLSQAALRQFIETRVIPQFAGTPGLRRMTAGGGPPIEYHVVLDPAALAATGLAASDVTAALAAANDVQSVGTTQHYHQRYVLLIDASLQSARDLGNVGVPLKSGGGTVPLGSLGHVVYATGQTTAQAATHGEHAVALNAFLLPGADAVSLQREIVKRMDAARRLLPADTRVTKYWDQTRLIVDSQASLRDAILLGAALAVLVIYLFLRNLRMTLVAAAIIPIAMAITIFALERSGQTLNLMSVGGLAVAVGLIIDDAIVVIEAIARGIAEDPDGPRGEVIARSAGALAIPMIASTSTTVVVFLPLGLLSGVPGFFFRALAFTLSTSLVVSIFLAIFLAPVLARTFLASGKQRIAHGDALDRVYAPVLRWALRRRAFVYAGAAVVLVTTVVLMLALPSDFLPKLDEGEFEIKYTLPPGATLRDSDRAAATMESIVSADPDVASEGRLTGVDTNGYTPTQANSGTVRATLVTGNRASYDEISSRLRDKLAAAVPASSFDFHQLLEDQINDLSGAPSPIEITITGPSQSRLIELAKSTTDAIGKVPGVVDAFNGVTYDDPTLQIVPSAARLALLGAGSSDLADALSAKLQGSVATDLAGSYTTTPVRVSVGGSPVDIANGNGALELHGGAPGLDALASIARPGLSTDVHEENSQRLIRVSANTQGSTLSTIVAGIQDALHRNPMPPGYTATIGGTYVSQQASFHEFATVIEIAVALVFTVMLATFGSFALPLVILCAIPLALIGVVLGLAVTQTPLNVSSFMGLLLLVGIVVKNGILLIDVANRRRKAGDDVDAALIAAGTERLRPILMTTLAAIGGLFPLALGLGAGAAMEKPLAIAVIGGLSTATVFTLVLIPVLYATFTGGTGGMRSAVSFFRRRRTAVRATAVIGVAVACALAVSAADAQSGGASSGGASSPSGTQSAPTQTKPTQPSGAQSGTSRPGSQPTVTQPSSGTSASPSGDTGGAPSSGSGAPSTSGGAPTTGSGVSTGASAAIPDVGVPPSLGSALQFANLGIADAQTAALLASPDVRSSRAALSGAQAAYAQARGTNGLSGTANYTLTPQGSAGGTIGARVTNLGVSTTLADLLAYGPLVAQAGASLEAARSDELVAERTERVRLIGLYYAALKARAVAIARTSGLTSAQRFVQQTALRYRAGDAPRLDVLRAQVALAQTRAGVAAARASDANATDALARETGRPIALFTATGGAGGASRAPLVAPDAAVARALATRGDLRSAELTVRAAQYGVTAARREALPAVTLGAGYSTGVDSGYPISGPTVSAQLTLPFTSIGSARVRAQQSQVEIAAARRDGIARSIQTDVAASARTAAASVEARAATEAAVSAARQEIDAANLGYANGASTSLEVTQARATYAQAVIDDLSALYDELQARATLQLETGP